MTTGKKTLIDLIAQEIRNDEDYEDGKLEVTCLRASGERKAAPRMSAVRPVFGSSRWPSL